MFAPQNQTSNVIDSLNGNLEDWYNAVDNSIKKSDVIPGNYEYTINTSYGNVGKILEGSSTHFDISVDRFKIASLENSYISWTQTVNVNVPRCHHTVANNGYQQHIDMFYIGFKSAFDAIAQYRIYSNSDHVQTQNHANYEWFMIYNSLSDEAKENSDCFATFNKINNMNPFVPGVYVKLDNTAAHTIPVTFTIKIPLSSFLMLYNLKYFPHWAGKLTIEVYPSYKNIVVCPVLGKQINEGPAYHQNLLANPLNVQAFYQNPANIGFQTMYHGFSNIDMPITGNNYDSSAANNVITMQNAQFTSNPSNCYVEDCKIRLATYLLKIDLANALAAKYTQIPLIFPIQTTQIKDFTSELPVIAGAHFTSANTIALKHCDAMFIVFKNENHATTCFNNPLLDNFRINVDGKFYPREELSTYNDIRFYNLTLDALNINNNPCTSISKDLATSLQPFVSYKQQGNNNLAGVDTNMWLLGDYSNFMIGIPFCDSEDFMGGLSSNGTVQIELSGTRANINVARRYFATAICFEDCYLKIRAVKPDGRPQIEVTNATLEQMSLGGL